MSNSIVAHFEPPVQDRRKLAKHLAIIDPLDLHYCFTCPLPDCVDSRHPACPIWQARQAKKQHTPPGAAPLQSARPAPMGRPA